MRAVTLWQPWATLIAVGAKKIETRSWPTRDWPCWLAIHAAKHFSQDLRDLCDEEPFRTVLTGAGIKRTWRDGAPRTQIPLWDELPVGAIVAVAWLHRVGKIGRSPRNGGITVQGHDLPIDDPNEIAFGDYTPGRYGWSFSHVRALPEPIPCKGAQGIWETPDDVDRKIVEMIGRSDQW